MIAAGQRLPLPFGVAARLAEFPCRSRALALIPQKALMLDPQDRVTVVLQRVRSSSVKMMDRGDRGGAARVWNRVRMATKFTRILPFEIGQCTVAPCNPRERGPSDLNQSGPQMRAVTFSGKVWVDTWT